MISTLTSEYNILLPKVSDKKSGLNHDLAPFDTDVLWTDLLTVTIIFFLNHPRKIMKNNGNPDYHCTPFTSFPLKQSPDSVKISGCLPKIS